MEIDLSPEDAVGLVQGAVDYAGRLGIAPTPDFETARRIFGSIDPRQATRQFTYGQDGKPHFIAGPYDDRRRCKEILSLLERSCGHGGYNFTMPAEMLPPGLEQTGTILAIPADED